MLLQEISNVKFWRTVEVQILSHASERIVQSVMVAPPEDLKLVKILYITKGRVETKANCLDVGNRFHWGGW